MKIAFLSTFYPFRGGIAQFNAALFQEFKKKNDIKAFTFSRQYPGVLFPGSSQYVSPADDAAIIDSSEVLDTINPFTYWTAANQIRKFQPDLMLMKFWMTFFAPSLGSVAYRLKKKTKIISILDNVIPHEKRPGDIAMTKFFLRQNHGFVVMSDAVKNDLLSLKPDAKFLYHGHPLYDHFGAKADKNDARKKLHIPENKKLVLFFGFIRDYKGLDLLIRAFKGLPDDYILLVAGEVYGNFDKYDQLIDQLNLRDKINLQIRYINDHEVADIFSAADVCVLPYKSATQSGITSIAYHFDLPMIATDTGGLKETIQDGKTGIIVKEPHEDLIRLAILDFFENNKSLSFVKEIQNLREVLSWKHLSDSILSFSGEL